MTTMLANLSRLVEVLHDGAWCPVGWRRTDATIRDGADTSGAPDLLGWPPPQRRRRGRLTAAGSCQ
jgi:hypothetical protein